MMETLSENGLLPTTTRPSVDPNALQRYLDTKFPKQSAFVADRSRFLAAQCSRRAGKSNGLALRFFHTMETHPGSTCIYLALTRESAFEIMWPVLQEQNERLGIGCTFTESKLEVTHPNGARLVLMGADMKNFIKRLKGRKSPGIAIDETQDFGDHLQSLIDDVLTPMMLDYPDAWMALTGTPGPVPSGLFFEITNQHRFSYSLHEWTLLENPYLPDPKAFVDDIKAKREWDDENPTYLREYCNRWVLDLQSLLIKYNPDINHYDKLPKLPQGGKWHYITGVDFGLKDSDALGTIAWAESTDEIYLVDEQLATDQDITDIGEQINAVRKRFNPDKLPTDEGALGKKIAEELRRRLHIPLTPADKTRKMENVALLNDWLRRGKFKAKRDSQFAKDSYKVQIDWDKSRPDKIVVKSGYHSDIIDAVLYAFKESPAFTYQAPKKEPKYGSKEWAIKQEQEMFEKELERMQEEQERLRNAG
jgi:hypothetical protein